MSSIDTFIVFVAIAVPMYVLVAGPEDAVIHRLLQRQSLRTWHYETLAVTAAVAAVVIASGASPVEWVGWAALVFTHGQRSVSLRLAESQGGSPVVGGVGSRAPVVRRLPHRLAALRCRARRPARRMDVLRLDARVIGIGEHFSMLLADGTEPWDELLDGVAELAAARQVLSGVDVAIRPSDSMGPVSLSESIRFARMTLAVASAIAETREYSEPAPASLDEIRADESPSDNAQENQENQEDHW